MEKNQNEIIYIVDPQKAIAAIANATTNSPVILDFDETLLLRNSTAEYINNLRPRLIGYVLIIVITLFRPWVWLPLPFRGDQTRDWFLVILPTILLPWTLLLWRQKAKILAQDYSNSEIISALDKNKHPPVIVASLGFNFIINPILQRMPIRSDLLVGCRFWLGAGDRNKGKLVMMQEVLSDEAIKSSILVTDSKDDLPLLQVVEQPYLVKWSLAKYVAPFQDFWLYSLVKKLKKII